MRSSSKQINCYIIALLNRHFNQSKIAGENKFIFPERFKAMASKIISDKALVFLLVISCDVSGKDVPKCDG